MCSRTGSRSLRASSGSRSASISIEPFKSAKRTVTCLRSPSRADFEVRIFSTRCLGVYVSGGPSLPAGTAVESATNAPQPPQNFSLPSFTNPQDGHTSANDDPHSPQKRRPSRFSAWQRGHRIAGPPRERGRGRSDRCRELRPPRERGQGRDVSLHLSRPLASFNRALPSHAELASPRGTQYPYCAMNTYRDVPLTQYTYPVPVWTPHKAYRAEGLVGPCACIDWRRPLRFIH